MKGTVSYKKRGLLVGTLLGVLFLAAAILCFFPELLYGKGDDRLPLEASISQNGKELYRIALSQVTTPYAITITGEDGCENVLWVENNNISMQSATCPDKLCVKMGKAGATLLPIICLPNGISVEVHSQSSSTQIDALSY